VTEKLVCRSPWSQWSSTPEECFSSNETTKSDLEHLDNMGKILGSILFLDSHLQGLPTKVVE
jgi:hypothetical protein